MSKPPPTAVVTGASRGIGAAVAARLAADGNDLIVVARNGSALDELADNLAERHRVAIEPVQADIGTDVGLEAVLAAIRRRERIDRVVNNAHASVMPEAGPMSESRASWTEMLDVNLRAPAEVSRAAVEKMARGGSIVNVVSTVAFVPLVEVVGYGVTKAALWSLTQHQALAWAPEVRVNAVCPGTVAANGDDPRVEHWNRIGLQPPLERFGNPDEVAEIIRWVGSSSASYITGQVIFADGGRVAAGGRSWKTGA